MTSTNNMHVVLGLENGGSGSGLPNEMKEINLCGSEPNRANEVPVSNCMARMSLEITSCSRSSSPCHTSDDEVNHLEGLSTKPLYMSNPVLTEKDLEIGLKSVVHKCQSAEDVHLQSDGPLPMQMGLNVELAVDPSPNRASNQVKDSTLENGQDMSIESSSQNILPVESGTSLNVHDTKQIMDCSNSTINSPVKGIHNHPAYKTVIQELMNSKEQIGLLSKKISQLEFKNEQVKAHASSSQEMYEVQLETLDKTVNQQQSELRQLSELNQQQAETSSKNYNSMKHDLETQLERVTKMYDSANKDREATVMRYAVSEKEVIDLKRDRESLERRMKEVAKEKDVLVGKLKSVTAERDRVSQILDTKCHELTRVQKENEKIKEDLNSREIKIKWAQNKLCSEMETHKETQTKLDKMTKKLQDTKEESEQVRRDCQSMMRAFQTSEENKAYTLEQQVKEQQATLIMERHERQDREASLRQLTQEFDSLKGKRQTLINENNQLSVKVQHLEKERLEYEQNLSKLKRTNDDQRQQLADLRSQLAEMESLRIQLQHEQEKLSSSHDEVERLRSGNAELQQDMAACREREAELLDFTQKLTDKNVRLQSEFSATEAKSQRIELELEPQKKRVMELESQVTSQARTLEQERGQRLEESRLLARHLAEKTQLAESLARKLEDQEGENQVLRRKQAATVKELMRELGQARKRLELAETPSGNTSLGHNSRASSSTSLNTLEPNLNPSGLRPGSEITSNGSEHSVGPLEPDRQLLIERIVKLQRANARKTEKLEFMEEHSRQLVEELQKKSRLVQNYIMREQSGALSSDTMDRNKPASNGQTAAKGKAEVTRHGGIMASVYGSKSLDDTMTLDLSLEINRKLQAVLEDTLLKNITLKESIDTLGAEISRLQQDRRENT